MALGVMQRAQAGSLRDSRPVAGATGECLDQE